MQALILASATKIKKQILALTDILGYESIVRSQLNEINADLLREGKTFDLLIMDMDGQQYWSGEIQKLPGLLRPYHFPVIYLTRSSCDSTIRDLMQVGHCYIVKPIDNDVLLSAIELHSKSYNAYLELAEANKQLLKYRNVVNNEFRVIEKIFASHTERNITLTSRARFHISPASLFNGDVLLSTEGPSGSNYFLIGDVTGHGLAAAVVAMPVYPTFRTMAQKGLGVGIIAAEMNKALLKIMPEHMMMAATVIEMDASGHTLTVWSGGMPGFIQQRVPGVIHRTFQSEHAPLAALSDYEFSQTVTVIDTEINDRFYFFTDGIEEARNAAGEMFGEQRLLGLFSERTEDHFSYAIESLNRFSASTEQDDDITLLELTSLCNVRASGIECFDKVSVRVIPWEINFVLSEKELKLDNPLHQIISILQDAEGISVHQDYLSTILSELFNNALEHGLLKLDSSMKEDDDGFIEYYMLRKERLMELVNGEISINIRFFYEKGLGQVALKVTDSGDGFDVNSSAMQNLLGSNTTHGRGFGIVRSMVDKLEFLDGGRTSRVVYTINR